MKRGATSNDPRGIKRLYSFKQTSYACKNVGTFCTCNATSYTTVRIIMLRGSIEVQSSRVEVTIVISSMESLMNSRSYLLRSPFWLYYVVFLAHSCLRDDLSSNIKSSSLVHVARANRCCQDVSSQGQKMQIWNRDWYKRRLILEDTHKHILD